MARPETSISSTRANARAGSRLTVEDWIDAGLELIAEEGLRSVKIDPLCSRLGVTKGSFYWHFSDIQGYLDALAEAWAQEQRSSHASLEALRDLEPEERLTSMMRHLTGPRQWILERAIREWARWDEDVADQVRASDRSIYREVRRAFLDAGLPRKEAGLRARAAFVLGVGFIHVAERAPTEAETRENEHILELLIRA
ncbi:MAG TPA: TetR/AcrR family transcriptional regulator [Solirubrobacteraceae bacterium]|nr:TetR/AcrR family transcriptional regulator [Solirubrobacteraceae bacterium]